LGQNAGETRAIEADAVIIGAGLAGSLAAFVLAKQGMRVTVIDRHAIYPRAFRCEKLSGAQMAILLELGALDCISNVKQRFNRVLVMRGGRTAGWRYHEECGFTYSDLVNALRGAWPEGVTFFEGIVTKAEMGPDLQRIELADGRAIEARLAIAATGLPEKLHSELGIKRTMIRRAHSFCIGFSIAPSKGGAFPFDALTYFGKRAGDRIGYATFFPAEKAMRVNLFTYHENQDAWARQFRQDPIGTLSEAMPGLASVLGDVQLVTRLDMRATDLYATEDYRRDGMVLIGDAFRSSCPATGTGVTRVLTDVRQLCLVHLPRWFAAAGMDASKIASFYDDPVKRACDERAARAAERSRSFAVETGLRQRFERGVILLGSHVHGAYEAFRHRHAPGPVETAQTAGLSASTVSAAIAPPA